ncbi:hypothetical protein AWB64_04627 [Caballeronia sordidicola]|uniref:DUF2252 domain-containing protein n=1 Tax=Caballeronia sordidicola TaxID=196367 RepID=A0A158HHM6_CABSO|nr:DUF2252 domain-containing protein [Caballeronia sordidicola]SAL43563.1 hypothetical protein AWB64_04627 [Caballeronia sordidicola]
MAGESKLASRIAMGKAYRENMGRSAHAKLGKIDRDPVELLEQSSLGRVNRLVPLRYGRMMASPFSFFRGSAILQANDLGKSPSTGLVLPICGDAHLMNFGGFATPERQLIFDLNDFDEVALGPWEWDLKRLTASFMVAARHMRLSRLAAEKLVETVVAQYQTRMREYADFSALELWYERITFERMLDTAVTPERRRLLRKGMEKAASRTHESMLEKVAEFDGENWTLRDMPPGMFHIHGANTLFDSDDDWFKLGNWEAVIKRMFAQYVKTLAHDRRALLRHFTAQDLAFKVVGVGSVGTRCLVLLMMDELGKPMFLQIKEARLSVIEQHFEAEKLAHAGERVVRGQRVMQAASDIFLGWGTGPSGRHFYFRQLRDMKLSANIELFDVDVLEGYARLCGWILARAHAKASGKAIEISAYCGQGSQMTEALVSYSTAYADQVERDFDLFTQACRSGRLLARTDEDMAADFHV